MASGGHSPDDWNTVGETMYPINKHKGQNQVIDLRYLGAKMPGVEPWL